MFFKFFFFMLSSENFLAGLIEPKDQCVFVDKGYLLVKVFCRKTSEAVFDLLSFSMFLMFFVQ